MIAETYPCREYGHFDCASTEYGACQAEKYARLMAKESSELVTWSCADCGSEMTAYTYLDIRQCGDCGEWQDVPDGSGLRIMD